MVKSWVSGYSNHREMQDGRGQRKGYQQQPSDTSGGGQQPSHLVDFFGGRKKVQLFIGGVSPQVSDSSLRGDIEEFRNFFETYGPLAECRLMLDKTTSSKLNNFRIIKRVWLRHFPESHRHDEGAQQKIHSGRKRGIFDA